MYRFVVLALLFVGPGAVANEGPYAPPCPICPEYLTPPYPHSGLWHNPQRSGTGINIDVQNGTMTAVYYGYRDDGSSVWYLASGKLVQSDQQDVYWSLEADLIEASNGEPVNGEHRLPEHESAGTLRLDVLQRHLIQFSINEGPTQRMVPLMFGSHSIAAFEPESDVHLPTFEEMKNLSDEPDQPQAPWLIIQRNTTGELIKWGYAFSDRFPHWGQVFELKESKLLYYRFMHYDFFPHTVESATIECGRAIDLAAVYPDAFGEEPGNDPLCITWSFTGNILDGKRRVYYMPIGNMGDRRFTAVSEDGWAMEGFRLGYD